MTCLSDRAGFRPLFPTFKAKRQWKEFWEHLPLSFSGFKVLGITAHPRGPDNTSIMVSCFKYSTIVFVYESRDYVF
jgi:hypothetical protein